MAELRRVPEEQDVLRQDRRPTPPVSVKGPRVADAYPVPQGYGFHRLPKTEIKQRIVSSDDVHVRFDGLLQIFEYPRARGERRYVISVDVGDGLGQDYSVATVVRLPTVEEIAEDVAQFVSNTLDTKQFTFVVDALGRLYQDDQQIEALAAIETNNHGLSVQDMLQLHMGYSNFYVWEYYNAATPEKRFSQRIGWSTTAATRPLLLSSFHAAITNCDPLTDRPDYRINSPITRQELRHFITRTNLSEAEAAPKQHDDAIFSSAIGYYVAYRLAGGEAEPLSERRRRKHALSAYFERVGAEAVRRDFRNTDVDAADCEPGGWGEGGPSDDPLLEAGVGLYFDPRNSDGE